MEMLSSSLPSGSVVQYRSLATNRSASPLCGLVRVAYDSIQTCTEGGLPDSLAGTGIHLFTHQKLPYVHRTFLMGALACM